MHPVPLHEVPLSPRPLRTASPVPLRTVSPQRYVLVPTLRLSPRPAPVAPPSPRQGPLLGPTVPRQMSPQQRSAAALKPLISFDFAS